MERSNGAASQTNAPNVGDKILLRTHPQSSKARGFSAKLAPKRDGVYEISKIIGPSIFQVWDPVREVDLGQYHADHLTYFPMDVDSSNLTPLPVTRRTKRGRPRTVMSSAAPGLTHPPSNITKKILSDTSECSTGEPVIDTLDPGPLVRDSRLRQGPRSPLGRFLHVAIRDLDPEIATYTNLYSSAV